MCGSGLITVRKIVYRIDTITCELHNVPTLCFVGHHNHAIRAPLANDLLEVVSTAPSEVSHDDTRMYHHCTSRSTKVSWSEQNKHLKISLTSMREIKSAAMVNSFENSFFRDGR